MPQIRRAFRSLILSSFSTLLILAVTTGEATAFDELTEAQAWIYDRGHLANTSEGQTLTYDYSSRGGEAADIDDKAVVSITGTHDGGRRDIDIDFLNDERHLPLPSFSDYRGNPVIIAMLEHVAQSISTQTGGGALYFRNRIRDALASDDVELEKQTVQYHDNDVETTRITFYPFSSDERLASNQLMRDTRFSIYLSDDVPGGVYSVEVKASHDAQLFEKTLSLN